MLLIFHFDVGTPITKCWINLSQSQYLTAGFHFHEDAQKVDLENISRNLFMVIHCLVQSIIIAFEHRMCFRAGFKPRALQNIATKV